MSPRAVAAAITEKTQVGWPVLVVCMACTAALYGKLGAVETRIEALTSVVASVALEAKEAKAIANDNRAEVRALRELGRK